MLKYLLITINSVVGYSFTVMSTNILKQTIIVDKRMPTLYTTKVLEIFKPKQSYSLEHIFPRSFMDKKDHNDMHNIVRTVNYLNSARSNYKFMDEKTNDYNWLKLDFENFVNHKSHLFVPTTVSKGIIARSILYMSHQYNYDFRKIIDKNTLLKWFLLYPPTDSENYHNYVVKQIQKKDNKFISDYAKFRDIFRTFSKK